MEKINLIDILMSKVSPDFSLETKKTIKYFLKENINTIFGKTKFRHDEFNIKPYNEHNSTCVVNGFYFTWYENTYNFSFKKDMSGFLSIICKNSNQYFTLNIQDKMIYNHITYDNNENIIQENSIVFAGSSPRFEYAKKIIGRDWMAKENTCFEAVPTGIKKNNCVQFRIENIDDIEEPELQNKATVVDVLKSILYVIKFELQRTKKVADMCFINENDMFDNLKDIFGTLKKYVKNGKEDVRKRVKQ